LRPREARLVAKLGLIAALIGTLTIAALFFLSLAAFIWAEGEFGASAAATGLGIFFLALVLVLAAVAKETAGFFAD